MRSTFCCVSLLALAGTAAAGDGDPVQRDLALSVSYERLDHGYADWSGTIVDGRARFASGTTLYALARTAERFNQSDNELQLGTYLPLSASAPHWGLTLESSASDTHRVLPEYSLYGALGAQLAANWVVTGGYRRTEYLTQDARERTYLASLALEHYFSNWRAAATLYRSGLADGATAGSASLQLDHYYRDDSRVGIAGARGEELENVGPPLGVLRTRTTTVTLQGAHRLDQHFAFEWSLGRTQQGSLYTRSGALLGLRYRF